jgi:hypothetical protein
MRFMIPLIIMSTITGTANFAQNTFPTVIRPYIPAIIGAVNLFCAILTTLYQFLKISENMEAHRITSINFGKYSRNITVELSLPVKDRSTGGAECVKVSRTEIDRLIEQSPSIPKHVLDKYAYEFMDKGIAEPEIIIVKKVDIYEDVENKVAVDIAEAGLKFKNAVKKNMFGSILKSNASSSPTTRKKEEISTELSELNTSKLVSSGPSVGSLITKLMGASSKKEKAVEIPVFSNVINNEPETV